MYKEQTTIEATKKPEAQENHEVPQSVESPEDLRQQMMSESEKETDHFKSECVDDIAQTEARAEKDELTIDSEDKKSLEGLGAEAEVAKKELEEEIVGESEKWTPESDLPPPLPEEEIRKFEKTEASFFSKENVGDEPPPLPTEDAVSFEAISKMKERIIKTPELLNTKESSKIFLAEQRKKLAEELLEQRRLNRENLASLREKLTALNEKLEIDNMDWEKNKQEYEALKDERAEEANSLTGRVRNLFAKITGYEFRKDQENAQILQKKQEELEALRNDKESLEAELENLSLLIEGDDLRKKVKEKIKKHYEKANLVSKEKFEKMQKGVEQVTLRNSAFIVHTFLLNEELRHNDNSNISQRATLEDDMDMLLSLEPSISTSSVIPGIKQGLWGGRLGVLLGGGDIVSFGGSDIGTVAKGIKNRTSGNSYLTSAEQIDDLVSKKEERGYNELVVDNPEVFGFFQNVGVGESGEMIGFYPDDSSIQSYRIRENKRKRDEFIEHMGLAAKKGMPLFVMTPDRRVFQFKSIGEEGVVTVGEEITPEQVALGKAGLSSDKRKDIGEQIINKHLFKNIEHQKEAKEIIAELSGKEKSGVELSQEEYLAYARDNQGRFHDFPKHLLEDKKFMLEVAQFNPVSAYQYAGENLKKDLEFIERTYSLEKKGVTSSIYSLMPDELKKNENIALLAIENNDFENIDSALADSPAVWEKIVDKIVERNNPAKWFSRNVGEQQVVGTTFYMQKGFSGVDMTEKLTADTSFVQKLNSKYPNYKFEIDEYKQLLVTKLAE